MPERYDIRTLPVLFFSSIICNDPLNVMYPGYENERYR